MAKTPTTEYGNDSISMLKGAERVRKRPEVIFGPILSFARMHRFTPSGAIWGSMLLVDCSGGKRKHYYDTYMPFL